MSENVQVSDSRDFCLTDLSLDEVFSLLVYSYYYQEHNRTKNKYGLLVQNVLFSVLLYKVEHDGVQFNDGQKDILSLAFNGVFNDKMEMEKPLSADYYSYCQLRDRYKSMQFADNSLIVHFFNLICRRYAGQYWLIDFAVSWRIMSWFWYSEVHETNFDDDVLYAMENCLEEIDRLNSLSGRDDAVWSNFRAKLFEMRDKCEAVSPKCFDTAIVGF